MKKLSRKDHKVFVECEIFDTHFKTPWPALIYFKIVMMSNNIHGGCFVKPSFFEELFNLSSKTVKRTIDELIKQGYINIKEAINQYNEKIKVMTPLKFFGKDDSTVQKSGTTVQAFSPKNTSQTLMDKDFYDHNNAGGQKNRRKQKNIRTEERQTHEQKSISEIDWSDFDSSASSDSDSDFFVSDCSDSGLVKQLEEHMHESQAHDLIRKFGTQKVESVLNQVNTNNQVHNKGGCIVAMLTKSYETKRKEKYAKTEVKRTELERSEQNWKAINRWLNMNNEAVQQFYQDLIDRKIPSGKLTHEVKTLLLKHQTGLINKPFDITFANRSVSINALRGYLHPEVLQSATTN